MNTWIIEPNWLAWTLLSLSTVSLVSIAVCLWCRKHKDAIDKYNILAWISFIIGIIALIAVFFRESNENNASLLIAALGVLVTLLVGWQIYTTIGITHKMAKAEKKITRMLKSINSVKSDVSKTVGDSNNMVMGVSRLSSAITLFFYSHKNDKISQESKIKNYAKSYVLSLGCIEKFINLNDKTNELLLLDLCLQIMEKSGNVVFDDKCIDISNMVFNDLHKKCDEYYDSVIVHISKFNETQKDIMNNFHSKRTSLKSYKYSNENRKDQVLNQDTEINSKKDDTN